MSLNSSINTQVEGHSEPETSIVASSVGPTDPLESGRSQSAEEESELSRQRAHSELVEIAGDISSTHVPGAGNDWSGDGENTDEPPTTAVISPDSHGEANPVPQALELPELTNSDVPSNHIAPTEYQIDTLALSGYDDSDDDEEPTSTETYIGDDDVIRIHLTFVDDEVSKIEIVGTGDDAQEWINAAAKAERQSKKRKKKGKGKKGKGKKDH